jgi:hypothetical protein
MGVPGSLNSPTGARSTRRHTHERVRSEQHLPDQLQRRPDGAASAARARLESAYVASPGDLAISIDSANDPHRSDLHNTFTPSTWRLVGQTVTVDKVCAEQQLMQGHATVSLIKNDGTPCTVTSYSQGTRVVAGQ